MKQKVSLFAILFFEQKKKGKGEPEAIRSWQKNTPEVQQTSPHEKGTIPKGKRIVPTITFSGLC